MAAAVSTAIVSFIACHGGPANHFAVYAEELARKGYTVEIYANGPALTRFREYGSAHVHEFSLEGSEEDVARSIAERCSHTAVVITDVGHSFDITLQHAFETFAPRVTRIAYYDNPETYVPGGYSEVAAKVMKIAQKVLFANANLEKLPLYSAPDMEVALSDERKIGLGYYPLEQAKALKAKREREREATRARFFSEHSLVDEGQKIWVYAGGNNEAYFSKALPACLAHIDGASAECDLSNGIFLLQQHPGAKAKNIDGRCVIEWMESCARETLSPTAIVSKMTTDEALTIADYVLYYQTSMGPQFVLAGIPAIQIGHETYEDVLVRNGLCEVALSSADFIRAISAAQGGLDLSRIYEGLGMRESWPETLEGLLKE